MQLIKEVIKLETDLQESSVVYNLMDDFPPICKQDPPDVRAHYVYEHWKATGETIKYDDIPDTMYGGTLPVAPKKRKSKKQATSEDSDEEESSEPKPKKAKKEKAAAQVNVVGSAIPTIQEQANDLEPVKIIEQRTRGKKSIGSSGSIPPRPSIPKKKRKHSFIKLKVSTDVMEEGDQIEAATNLVTIEVKRKKVADDVALKRALEIAKGTDIPNELLLKESSSEHAKKVVELGENLQELVVVGDLLNVAEEVQRENVPCSGSGTS